ncbi:MAG: DNAase [Betaproteobacteria bacterium RIFCSPLOWO2_12_FULL_64_23]|nr:MAG: DNAase [Betaproteobacteria bacterium RIFCSPLOWO2_12_FULL_64_23]
MLVDSHCHIDFEEYADQIPRILDGMARNQVTHALCVCVNLTDFPGVLALAEGHAQFFASVGVHPDQAEDASPSVGDLIERAQNPKIVAIGETGLDYYRQNGDLEWQRTRFRTHIRAARECGKPLIIHTRDAGEDTLRIMREERANEAGGVMHCFTETLEIALAAMELNFHISFSGIVTFKNAHAIKAIAKAVPLERMLVETDSPYLAPVPQRGKTNEPGWVRHVAEEIARLRGTSLEAVAAATSGNFFRLFKPISY